MLLGIDKQGQWHLCDANNYLQNASDPAHIALTPTQNSVALVPGQSAGQLIDAHNGAPLPSLDVIFPIVHGTQGEDGTLQGLLRMANLPFVGSDVLGSAACMDKDVTKRLLRDAGLAIAPFVTLTRSNRERIAFSDVQAQLGLPLFVKPANQGSSVGVSKVTNEAQYHEAVRLIPSTLTITAPESWFRRQSILRLTIGYGVLRCRRTRRWAVREWRGWTYS